MRIRLHLLPNNLCKRIHHYYIIVYSSQFHLESCYTRVPRLGTYESAISDRLQMYGRPYGLHKCRYRWTMLRPELTTPRVRIAATLTYEIFYPRRLRLRFCRPNREGTTFLQND